MKVDCYVDGFVNRGGWNMKPSKLHVQITNDDRDKTLSIDNGLVMFTIPYEPVEKEMGKQK